jgi:hypothetical protein
VPGIAEPPVVRLSPRLAAQSPSGRGSPGRGSPYDGRNSPYNGRNNPVKPAEPVRYKRLSGVGVSRLSGDGDGRRGSMLIGGGQRGSWGQQGGWYRHPGLDMNDLPG